MKSPKKNKSDQVEKELQDMIDQLNSENVALNKILSMVEPKEVSQRKKTDREGDSTNPTAKERNK